MRARSFLIATASVAVVAACGGAGQDEVVVDDFTAEQLVAASEATSSVDSAQVEMSATLDFGGLGAPITGPVTMEMTGEIDFANGLMAMEMDMSPMLEALGGAGELEGAPPEVLAMFSEPVRAVQDGTTQYQCWAFYEELIGTPCVRIDFEEVTGMAGLGDLGTGAPGAGGYDPAAMLDSLGGVDDLEEAGTEELFGIETRHLRGTLTLADAIDRLEGDDADALRDAYATLGFDDELLEAEMPFEVWVDDDGLVRRLHQEFEIPGLGSMSMQVDYVAFDVPVDIEIPTDAVDLLDLPGAGFGS